MGDVFDWLDKMEQFVEGVENPLVGHEYEYKLLGDANARTGLGLPAGIPSQQINTLMHLIESGKKPTKPSLRVPKKRGKGRGRNSKKKVKKGRAKK